MTYKYTKTEKIGSVERAEVWEVTSFEELMELHKAEKHYEYEIEPQESKPYSDLMEFDPITGMLS